MTGYLLDTNIPSELTRPVPNRHVEAFLREAGRESVHLSVLSMGEIQKGIASLPDGGRRSLLERWLELEIRPWFQERISPVSLAVAERWGILAAAAKRVGKPLAVIDGLIAATALERDLVLVTRNVKDFEMAGVATLNPWR